MYIITLKYVPYLMIDPQTHPLIPLYAVVFTEEQRRLGESKRRLPLPGGGANSMLPDTSGSLHSAGGLLHPAASPHGGSDQ